MAHIKDDLRGANAATGHLLRDPSRLPAPTQAIDTDVLIIGGGVSDLAARRWLHHHGREALLAELDQQLGGNAAAGRNPPSAYPWGAHYLPVPDPRNRELLDFLQEAGTLTGYAPDGRPTYNDYHLCHDPEDRLNIQGPWQEGLVPGLGLSAEGQAQIQLFFKLTKELKTATGNDGRDAFRIPLDESPADAQYRQFDQMTFAAYLDREGFAAPALRWYLDYCCRDDYGATAAQVSAWAGLHYFAGRKGRALNAAADVLTWPEGNHLLVGQLRRQADALIRTNTLAYNLRETATGLEALLYDASTRQTTRVTARQVLLATPQHVTRHLLGDLTALPEYPLHHAPWLIANLTIDGLPQGPGRPLSWNNVRYTSASLGYINTNQQDLTPNPDGFRVITLYWPLTDEAPTAARRRAYHTTYAEWLPRVVAELETDHPGVTPYLRRADLWVWGYDMVAPTPGPSPKERGA